MEKVKHWGDLLTINIQIKDNLSHEFPWLEFVLDIHVQIGNKYVTVEPL